MLLLTRIPQIQAGQSYGPLFRFETRVSERSEQVATVESSLLALLKLARVRQGQTGRGQREERDLNDR